MTTDPMFNFEFEGEAMETSGGSAVPSEPVMKGQDIAEAALSLAVVEKPGWLMASAGAAAGMPAYDSFQAGNMTLKRVAPTDTSIDGGRDIVPGVYEGGFKCWECSLDLFSYLLSQYGGTGVGAGVTGLSHMNGVLELGCGHAFPALAALQLGARPQGICLSDLNREVLEQITWPNLCLNHEGAGAVTCVAGDFAQLPAFMTALSGLEKTPYSCDLVLSAETLYTAEVSAAMYQVLLQVLSPGGVALLASKRYYFGCGGGSMDFARLCQQYGALSCETVYSVEDGKSNIRDILQVRRR